MALFFQRKNALCCSCGNDVFEEKEFFRYDFKDDVLLRTKERTDLICSKCGKPVQKILETGHIVIKDK